jgi:hypothetical protein
MRSRLSDRLLAGGMIGVEVLRTAVARQAVYGGALDTALLELGALDEARLWRALGEATGLPVPEPSLCERPGRYASPAGAGLVLDDVWSERCRAVPVGTKDGALLVLCGEPIADAELQAAATALGVPFALFVAPEVRLAAVRQAVFGRPMPPRLVKLLARVLGTQAVRRWQAAQVKRVVVEEQVGVEILERRAPPAPAAQAAPAVAATSPLAPSVRATAAPAAALGVAPPPRKLAEAAAAATADARARIPELIARLGDSADGGDAQEELVKLTARDLGAKPRRWQSWWEKHRDDDRAEWLFEGLGHKTPEIRAAAEEALRGLSGEYFGYHFDLPRSEREDARLRWQTWWYETLAETRG